MLSVIICCYNGQDTIKRCLDSIVKQTFKDYEIVFVNDGSNDNTLNIVEEFKRNNKDIDITIINQENIGSNLSKKVGVNNSKGEYITFIDADDYLIEDYYENLIIHFDDEIDIVCGAFTKLVDNKTHYINNNSNQKIIDKGKAKDLLLNQKGVYPYVWNKIFKKSLFKDIYFYPDRFIGEDFVLVSQLIDRANNLYLVNNNGYIYNINHLSQTRSSYGELYKNMYVVFNHFTNNNDIYKNHKKPLKRYITIHYMAILVSMVKGNTHDTEIEDAVLRYVRKDISDYIFNSNDGLMAKISLLIIKFSYPLFRLITKIVVNIRGY